MIPIDALEIVEPVRDVDVHAGTFEFVDKYQNHRMREFYVRTCEGDDSIRQNDANQQLEQAWELLVGEGCTNIRYHDVRPSPFF
jgi:hypothetical protein